MAIKRKGKAGQWGVGVQVLSADLNDTIYDISHQWGVSVLTDINVREFIAYATNIQLGGGITQHSKTYLGLNDISGNRSQTVTIPTNGNRVVLLFTTTNVSISANGTALGASQIAVTNFSNTNSNDTFVWMVKNPASGSVTYTVPSGALFAVYVFSGVDQTNPANFVTSSQNNSTNVNTPSNSITPSSAYSYLINYLVAYSATNNFNINTIQENGGGSNVTLTQIGGTGVGNFSANRCAFGEKSGAGGESPIKTTASAVTCQSSSSQQGGVNYTSRLFSLFLKPANLPQDGYVTINASNQLTTPLGIAIESKLAGETTEFVSSGIIDGFSGLTIGSYYYLNTTTGAIQTTASSFPKIGRAVTSTKLKLILV